MDLKLAEMMLIRHGVVTTIGNPKAIFVCQECYQFVDKHDPKCLLVQLLGDKIINTKTIKKAWDEWSKVRERHYE